MLPATYQSDVAILISTIPFHFSCCFFTYVVALVVDLIISVVVVNRKSLLCVTNGMKRCEVHCFLHIRLWCFTAFFSVSVLF